MSMCPATAPVLTQIEQEGVTHGLKNLFEKVKHYFEPVVISKMVRTL